MEDELHVVARIAGLFGVHGELKLDATTSGEALVAAGAAFALRLADGTRREATLETVRAHGGRHLVRLAGVHGASAAQAYVGATLLAERARVAANLREDELLDVELVGMRLETTAGEDLGAVVDVAHYPGAAMLVVGPRRTLVPFVKAFVLRVDRERRRLTVELPEGLLFGEPEVDAPQPADAAQPVQEPPSTSP